VLISVKSGKTSSPHIRDLVGVIDREKAAIGLLITLKPPTKDMRKEAADSGFYEPPWGRHPRIQILTVEELLDGKKLDMPPIRPGGTTFKTARRASAKDDQEQLL
jgi:hypothetical protein